MGCLSRQLGRSAADRVERVGSIGTYMTYAVTLNSVLPLGIELWGKSIISLFLFLTHYNKESPNCQQTSAGIRKEILSLFLSFYEKHFMAVEQHKVLR